MEIEEQQQLLTKVHEESGHRGRDHVYKTVQETHYWKTMWTDTGNFAS
jgi:hypothetical protein